MLLLCLVVAVHGCFAKKWEVFGEFLIERQRRSITNAPPFHLTYAYSYVPPLPGCCSTWLFLQKKWEVFGEFLIERPRRSITNAPPFHLTYAYSYTPPWPGCCNTWLFFVKVFINKGKYR